MRPAVAPLQAAKRPRLGFVGVGWIGRNRMEAILAADCAEIAGIAEPSREMAAAAAESAPGAEIVGDLDALLALGVDGVIVATPSALHAAQALRALESGAAVFCQKPLGRTAIEVAAILDAAERADRLLGVDLSYRRTEGMSRLHALAQEGAIGPIHAADLVFHNAYGPDKPWFYDRSLAGGGCVIDLGVHLIDLALWMTGFPVVEGVSSDLFAGGRRLPPDADAVEDYAVATLHLATGAVVRIACSWNLHAGQDAMISAVFHGREGSLSFGNVGGSFYDFTAALCRRTSREELTAPPDAWGGRAAVDWARWLARGAGFDPSIREMQPVAEVIDRIYGRRLSGTSSAAHRSGTDTRERTTHHA
jgi:predicted dehydrogenase